jgi:flagellar biosynthesis chaperone FliJ
MKKFQFSLGRVMDYRQTLERVEEAKLQTLYAELRGIDERKASINDERTRSERAVREEKRPSGLELAALDTFRRFAVAELTRLEQKRAECAKRVAAQIQVVAQKRRDVRLLDQLRGSRLKAWQREADREIDQYAEEAYLAKWGREA